MALQGYAPGGFPPRGYKAEQVEIEVKNNGETRYASKWIVDPPVAQLVYKAFKMRERGNSYREIHEETHIFTALAEKYGAEAAGERLLQREAEKERLEQELQRLQVVRKQNQIEASSNVIANILATKWDDLSEDDIAARRTFLRQFVDRVEMGKNERRLWYTFPIEVIDPTLLISVPPRGFVLLECQPIDLTWD